MRSAVSERKLLLLLRTHREPTNGAEVVAARLEQVGRRQFVPPAFNPLTRMKDTVVFGYLMASSKHGRVDVPDW